MFLLLGLTNARRNLGRSALAVLGVAVAAMIMTSILGLSGAYPARAHLAARTFLGADVVVYATRHLVRPDDLRQEGSGAGSGTVWAMTSLSPDLVCDLCALHPELYTTGFLSPGGVDLVPIEVAGLREALRDDPRVRFVNPSYFLPVRMTYTGVAESGRQETVEVSGMVLRSRDFVGQAEQGGWPFQRLAAGGVPGEGQQHARLALLDAQLRRLGFAAPGRGAKVTIWVPAVSVGPDGRWTYDFTAETAFEFTCAGTYQTLTNRVSWPLEAGTWDFEDLYWITPQIQIPAGTFEDIFFEVSGGARPEHALQVGLSVAPLSELEEIASEAGRALPEYSVISVPRQMAIAHLRGLPEAASRAPLDVLGLPSGDQIGMPVDLGGAFVVLSCLIGALLLASNMLFLVSRRRREIGVLKALGARAVDIVVMILSEGLALSLIGTVAGFAVIRLLVTWTLISNRISLGEIASATARHCGLVVGAAVAAAVLFGMVPAWRMSRLTSMEVLRNE